MLRILLIIAVALAVVIGLMKLNAPRNTAVAPAADAAAPAEEGTDVTSDDASVETAPDSAAVEAAPADAAAEVPLQDAMPAEEPILDDPNEEAAAEAAVAAGAEAAPHAAETVEETTEPQ
jgi:hypothetical protein